MGAAVRPSIGNQLEGVELEASRVDVEAECGRSVVGERAAHRPETPELSELLAGGPESHHSIWGGVPEGGPGNEGAQAASARGVVVAALGLIKRVATTAVVARADVGDDLRPRLERPYLQETDRGGVLESRHHFVNVREGAFGTPAPRAQPTVRGLSHQAVPRERFTCGCLERGCWNRVRTEFSTVNAACHACEKAGIIVITMIGAAGRRVGQASDKRPDHCLR